MFHPKTRVPIHNQKQGHIYNVEEQMNNKLQDKFNIMLQGSESPQERLQQMQGIFKGGRLQVTDYSSSPETKQFKLPKNIMSPQ